jgi:hypothetical protein
MVKSRTPESFLTEKNSITLSLTAAPAGEYTKISCFSQYYSSSTLTCHWLNTSGSILMQVLLIAKNLILCINRLTKPALSSR